MQISALLADSGLLGFSRRRLLLLAFILIAFANLASADTQTQGIRPVIDLATLKAQLAKPNSNLLLVDVRDSDVYALGHLPGAVNLPTERTFNQHGDHTRIASLQQIREIMSKLGIRNTDYLVLYDDGILKNAAHVFWVLETYGHRQLSVLDGGIAGWLDQHGEVTSVITSRAQTQYIPSISTRRLSTELATLLAIQNPNMALIDARDQQEYLGITSKARRKGHIPGAISIPWSENLVPQSQVPALKPKPALQSLYASLDKSKPIIAYCNRGKESAVTYLVLRELGYRVSVYDGAWLEWGNDEQLPIENGAKIIEDAAHGR